MSKVVIVIIVVAVLALVGMKFLIPAKEVVRIGNQYESEGQEHLNSLDQIHTEYKTDLPTSGPHFFQPAAWGISEVQIPDEQFVHNLEHGGVVITYRPDLSEEDINNLKVIVTNLTMKDDQTSKKGFKVILTPRSANTSPVQLSSWRYNLSLSSVDQAKIQQFYRDRPNIAPEANAL